MTNTKQKLEQTRELLTDLVELGEDYAHFQSAQYAHKTLKQMLKQIKTIV